MADTYIIVKPMYNGKKAIPTTFCGPALCSGGQCIVPNCKFSKEGTTVWECVHIKDAGYILVNKEG